ncbi:MAG: PilZ domain-containing protein [Leptospirales bacterium]
MKNEGQENRAYPRAKLHFKVEYSSDKNGPKKECYTSDISATGVSFETEDDFDINTSIFLNITLKELDTTVEAKGVILRKSRENEKTTVSLQFTEIDYDNFIVLLDYSLAFQNNENERN